MTTKSRTRGAKRSPAGSTKQKSTKSQASTSAATAAASAKTNGAKHAKQNGRSNGTKATRNGSVRRVHDTAVLKSDPLAANTSAFKSPTRGPAKLDKLSAPARRKLVAELIPSPEPAPSADVAQALKALEPPVRRFHGTKVPLHWFPRRLVDSTCADKFGYLFSASVRNASKLPFNVTTEALLTQLGNLMGDAGRDTAADSIIPAGYTYFGQFVDHDITLDVSSTIDAPQDAAKINNMRSPVLDLDNVYGRGPALDPYLFRFPGAGDPPTAVRMQIGQNRNTGAGGPHDAAGAVAIPATFDVPRVLNGTNTTVTEADSSFTAIIGDPRNDENLIVSQFHHALLKFHNRVVDLLVTAAFPGDIFAEAKKIVTQHYQWCVIHDFLPRVCGAAAVNAAISSVHAPVGSAFSMPAEFAMASYRFGHSMVRNGYILNSSLPPAVSTLANVFAFIRVPRLPVFSNWAVDFNMFFNTAHPVGASFNNARPIDSNLANGLEAIPGGSGIMAILAARNLRRGLALGLPSGQGAANALGIPPMTTAQLTAGLPAAEIALLNSNGGLLLSKTPLWYYVLREAMVTQGGNQLGRVGGRIVAETFVRMLKRDADSFMNVPGFAPSLPSSVAGTFTIADLLDFAGVLVQ
ncbi:MAG TPA: heme peroxidase family protein [Gemmatimonadaceae bacterium]|nr:heme peroxidase family protein [Gemmatimonadaceae bacterium]